jgi:hypothetical protein
MVVFTVASSAINVLKSDTPVICVICKMAVEPYCATAGSLYADGRQAFACTAHLRNRRNWIIYWTGFDIEQRLTRKQQGSAR